jgi:SNF2 family DNA or RNA helicase
MHITQDLKNIVLPWSPEAAGLQAIMPHAREITVGGERFMVMPNGQAECKVARNMGLSVPAPILTRYDWRGSKPWDIQRTTAAMLTESERAFVLNTMGTGKTRSVLYAADYLMQSKAVTGPMLVSAPLSTLTPVWEREIFNIMADRKVKVLYGSRAKRIRLLNEEADIYIINHHGLDVVLDHLCKRGFGILCVDELAVLRNRSTDLWRAHKAVEASLPLGAGFAWGLTGSPTPQAPTDAWAQCKLLAPNNVPKSMRSFHDMTMRAITQFKSVARPEATEIVHRAMQPAVRFTLQDVMELPETVYIDKLVKLDPPAKAAYDRLFQKARMITDGGKSITAVNEGVLHGKLMQVACGYIYADDHTVYELPHKGRLDALLECRWLSS